jgi:hypothetical protein
MCPAVTWTSQDHRSVDTVGLMRARITGETEQGDYTELMAKGVMKLEKVADIKVERKPGWLGY